MGLFPFPAITNCIGSTTHFLSKIYYNNSPIPEDVLLGSGAFIMASNFDCDGRIPSILIMLAEASGTFVLVSAHTFVFAQTPTLSFVYAPFQTSYHRYTHTHLNDIFH